MIITSKDSRNSIYSGRGVLSNGIAVHFKPSLTLIALIDHHLEAAVVVADHESGRLWLRQAVLSVVPLKGDDLRHLRGVGQALDVELGLGNSEPE